MATVESRLSDLELKFYDLIRLRGWDGLLCDEAEAITGLTHQCVSARFSDLEKKHKLIERRGATRKTRSGRPARIYVLKGLTGANNRVTP